MKRIYFRVCNPAEGEKMYRVNKATYKHPIVSIHMIVLHLCPFEFICDQITSFGQWNGGGSGLCYL